MNTTHNGPHGESVGHTHSSDLLKLIISVYVCLVKPPLVYCKLQTKSTIRLEVLNSRLAHVFFQVSSSPSGHCQVIHVLLDVDEVLGPLSKFVQHSFILTAVQRPLHLLSTEPSLQELVLVEDLGVGSVGSLDHSVDEAQHR